MSIALAILIAIVLILGPLTLALIVVFKRVRLRRIAEEGGVADVQVVYGDAGLEPPMGHARRTHSVGFAISEILARLNFKN